MFRVSPLRGRSISAIADESGSVAILFALLILSLSAGMGLAIDYSRALRSKEIIEKAADAANLAAAKAAAEMAEKSPNKPLDQIKTEAEAIGLNFFETNMMGNAGVTMNRHSISVEEVNGEWIATTDYEATSQTTLAGIIGPKSVTLAGTSEASVKPGFAVLDIAMCIDSTGSMTPTLDAVKANATTFFDRLNEELVTRGIPEFPLVRVRLLFFKDYGDETPGTWDPDPMRASAFFQLPDENTQFLDFAAPQMAGGGWDWPEADVVCLNEAMTSEWMRPGDRPPGFANRVTDVYPLIVVWTDSPGHRIDFPNYFTNPDYPPESHMPRSYDDLLAKWNDPDVIDQRNKQIIFFGDTDLTSTDATDPSPWLTIKEWPRFTRGGSLLDANASMVEFLADGISLQSRSLAITN